MVILGGTKRLEDCRDKQTTNWENMHRNLDEVLEDGPKHGVPRYLQSSPLANINCWWYIPFLEIGYQNAEPLPCDAMVWSQARSGAIRKLIERRSFDTKVSYEGKTQRMPFR